MSFKLRGSLTGPHFGKKKIGDIEKQVAIFQVTCVTSQNRHIDWNKLIELADQVDCSFELDILSRQLNFFDRAEQEVRLAELEKNEKVKDNEKATKFLKQIKADDQLSPLSPIQLQSRINEIHKLINPATSAQSIGLKTDQRQRLQELEYSEDVNRLADAQRLILKIQADDKIQKLTDGELEKRLDEVEALIKKANQPAKTKKGSLRRTRINQGALGN